MSAPDFPPAADTRLGVPLIEQLARYGVVDGIADRADDDRLALEPRLFVGLEEVGTVITDEALADEAVVGKPSRHLAALRPCPRRVRRSGRAHSPVAFARSCGS